MTKIPQQPAHNPCRAVWHNVLGDGSSPLSPTTHSFEPRDFPETAKEPAIGGLLRLRFGLRGDRFRPEGDLGRSVSGPRNPVSPMQSMRPVRMWCLPHGKTKASGADGP